MPKKNKVVSAIKTIHKVSTRAKRPVRRKNPGGGGGSSLAADAQRTLMPILPAAASYATARLVGRIIRMTVGAKVAGGRFERHFGPLGNLTALLAAYYSSKKVNAMRQYQQEMILGAGIALFQSLLETYIPALGHLIDVGPQAAQLPAAVRAKTGLAGAHQEMRPRRTRYVSPGELDSEKAIYNERVAQAQAQNVHSEAQVVDDEYPQSAVNGGIEYVDEIDEIVGQGEDADLYGGVFEN